MDSRKTNAEELEKPNERCKIQLRARQSANLENAVTMGQPLKIPPEDEDTKSRALSLWLQGGSGHLLDETATEREPGEFAEARRGSIRN